MKCPHCGNHIENTLWKALQPYRDLDLPVVVTNIDAILEVGPRIKVIFEEKYRHLNIRGFQAVTLKKIAKSLKVSLYYILRDGNYVEIFKYNTNQIVRADVYLKPETLDPVFSGSIFKFGRWIFRKFISPEVSKHGDNNRRYIPPSR